MKWRRDPVRKCLSVYILLGNLLCNFKNKNHATQHFTTVQTVLHAASY
jgi:hypothetical protein